MEIRTTVKHLLRWAVTASAMTLLGACGPAPASEETTNTSNSVIAFEIIPPTATMGCGWPGRGPHFTCSGSGSNGVPPYRYQWQVVDDFGGGSTSSYWADGTTTLDTYCDTRFATEGTIFTKYVRFRVIDANNYVSNAALEKFPHCWVPDQPLPGGLQ